MSNDAFQNRIRQALDARLTGVAEKPGSLDKVLRQAKGEVKVKKRVSIGLVIALVLVAVAAVVLAAELPFLKDTLTPGQDAPLSAATAEPAGIIPTVQDTFLVDRLSQVYGVDMTGLQAKVQNNLPQEGMQSDYADMTVDQVLWDGVYIYMSITVTPKGNYYLADYNVDHLMGEGTLAAVEASAKEANRPLRYIVLGSPELEPDHLVIEHQDGAVRFFSRLRNWGYGVSDGRFIGILRLTAFTSIEYVPNSTSIKTESLGYVVYSVPYKRSAMKYYRGERYFVDTRYLPEDTVLPYDRTPFHLISVYVDVTATETLMEICFIMTDKEYRDAANIIVEWLDENGNPYPHIENEKELAYRWYEDNNYDINNYYRMAMYKGMEDFPETITLQFINSSTGEVINTFSFDMAIVPPEDYS